MRRNTTLLALIAAFVLILTPACALGNLLGGEEAAPPPTPTRTPKPTFTPTPVDTPTPIVAPTFTPSPTPIATDTPVPTPTPAESPTPEPSPTPEVVRVVVNNPTLNVRSGPGTNYGLVGQARNGERYDVTGKNAAGAWWQINFNGQTGWVAGEFVTLEGAVGDVQVAANIPAAPVQPTRPPAPRPQPVPTTPPQPQPTSPPAPPPQPSTPWTYTGGAVGAPQCAGAFFRGQVQYANGSPQNGVCVLVDYYGPRTIKFSGSGGQGDGNWGFSPCTTGKCVGPYKIYVVQCPGDVPDGGLTYEGSGSFTPLSNIFEANITDNCVQGEWSNIIFKGSQ